MLRASAVAFGIRPDVQVPHIETLEEPTVRLA